MGRREQQVAELAERSRAYYIALIAGDKPLGRFLLRKDIEMVVPEIAEHLVQLSIARHRAHELLLNQLTEQLRRAAEDGRRVLLGCPLFGDLLRRIELIEFSRSHPLSRQDR